MNKDEKHKPMTRTGREAQAEHNDTTQETIAFFLRKIFANVSKTLFQMTLLLRNMTVYTRFNRFQHCAINKDEKHKPMSRTGRRA